MRDPERIGFFLQKLEELWKRFPDYRFGQLIYLIADKLDTHDIFYPEEDKWYDAMQEQIDNRTK